MSRYSECHLHASDTCWFCRVGSPIHKSGKCLSYNCKYEKPWNVRQAEEFALKAKVAKVTGKKLSETD